MKDWLGSEYTVGDLVMYAAMSGRSVTMILGRVTDIYMVYKDQETYNWKRLEQLGSLVPFKRKWSHELNDYVTTTEFVESQIRVQIQPLKSSRWQQHHGETRYIDTRTGKGINPWAASGKHVKQHAFMTCKTTGKKLDDHYRGECCTGNPNNDWWDHKTRTMSAFHSNYIYRDTIFKDYVKEIKVGPKPVTITVTENIVKWNGEL